MISVRAGSARARSEPGKVLLEARAITMAFGGFKAVSNADLSIERGEIVGLIGPNGAGKSTFFNCLAGDLRPTAGAVLFDGSDLTRASPEEHARRGIGRTFQVPVTFEDMTVLENVMVGAFLRHPHRKAARAEAGRVLEITGLLTQAGLPAHTLGTPGRKRLEIARVLATGPRLLLLDEALAGLTPAEIQHAIELVRDPPDRDHPDHRRAHHGGDRQPDRPRDRLQPGPCDRRGRAARGDDPPRGDRGLSRTQHDARAERAKLDVTRLVVQGLEVRYGDLVGVSSVSLAVEAGSVVALLGANGAGKTTTLNAIAGLVRRSRGHIEWGGEDIAELPAYAIVPKGLTLSPEGWRLFHGQTVVQNLMLGATTLRDKARVQDLLERVFALFPRLAERRQQRAGTLSGGERQMLALGRALMSGPRLLMLDEPSLGLAPTVVESLYETLARLHAEGLTLLLAEQSVQLVLEIADYGYVLQTGRTVLEGPAAELADDPQVRAIYLGIAEAT
jgi:branched-chain amino acid transport system ATP-binding protein